VVYAKLSAEFIAPPGPQLLGIERVSDRPIGEEQALAHDSGIVGHFPEADSRAIPLAAEEDLDRHVRRDLRRQELAIAREYMGGRMWPYVLAAWGGFALWLSLFPLTMLDIVPLPIAFVIACVLATGGYVTSHEAMHSNIAQKGSKHRWINEWVGQATATTRSGIPTTPTRRPTR
jgi:beta-carotene hydroxylase